MLLVQEQIFFKKALLNYLEIQIQMPMVVDLLDIKRCDMIQTKRNAEKTDNITLIFLGVGRIELGKLYCRSAKP